MARGPLRRAPRVLARGARLVTGSSIDPTVRASVCRSESVSSIAAGLRPPLPAYGLSKNHSSNSRDVTMTATPPIIVACTSAASPLSANKSM